MLRKLNDPRLRLFGINHVSVAWMTSEKEWTSEKGQSSNNLASNTIPLLDRAVAAAPARRGRRRRRMGGPGMGMAGAMMQQMERHVRRNGRWHGRSPGSRDDAAADERHGRWHGRHVWRRRRRRGRMKKEMTTLTRTDFLIQFVWQYKPEENPKTDEERNEKLKKIITDFTEAQKKNPAVKISEDIQKELDAASRKKSEQFDAKLKAPGPDNAAAAVPGGAVLPGANAPGAAVPKTGGP